MTSIYFGVTRSKVKVIVTLYVKMVVADFLENQSPQSLHIPHVDWSWLVDDPIDFIVSRSNVKVTVTLYVKLFTLIFLKFINPSNQCESRVRKGGGAYVSFDISCFPLWTFILKTIALGLYLVLFSPSLFYIWHILTTNSIFRLNDKFLLLNIKYTQMYRRCNPLCIKSFTTFSMSSNSPSCSLPIHILYFIVVFSNLDGTNINLLLQI